MFLAGFKSFWIGIRKDGKKQTWIDETKFDSNITNIHVVSGNELLDKGCGFVTFGGKNLFISYSNCLMLRGFICETNGECSNILKLDLGMKLNRGYIFYSCEEFCTTFLIFYILKIYSNLINQYMLLLFYFSFNYFSVVFMSI